jgi:hypothetical protein
MCYFYIGFETALSTIRTCTMAVTVTPLPTTLSSDLDWNITPPLGGTWDLFAILNPRSLFVLHPMFTSDEDVLDADYYPTDGHLAVSVVACDMDKKTISLRVHANTLPGVSIVESDIVHASIGDVDEEVIFLSTIVGLAFDGESPIENWVKLSDYKPPFLHG